MGMVVIAGGFFWHECLSVFKPLGWPNLLPNRGAGEGSAGASPYRGQGNGSAGESNRLRGPVTCANEPPGLGRRFIGSLAL